MDNIELYREMQGILRDGCYAWNNYRCCLKLQPEERSAAVYLSPRRVAELVAEEPEKVTYFDGRGTYFTHNEDSFAAAQGIMAWERYKQDLIYGWDDERIRPGRVLVLNFADPLVRTGSRPPEEELEALLYDRIMGILHVAAVYGYHYLVLGAWGCGAFGNDAGQMARLFERALKNFRRGDYDHTCYFRGVEFAVLDHSASQYNFNCFDRVFQHFYDEEDAKEAEKDRLLVERQRQEREPYRDKIRGCLLGGAGLPSGVSLLERHPGPVRRGGNTEIRPRHGDWLCPGFRRHPDDPVHR